MARAPRAPRAARVRRVSRVPRALRSPWLWIGVLSAVVVGMLAVGGVFVSHWANAVTARPPGVGTEFIAPTLSKAQRALDSDLTPEQQEAAEYLAAQPSTYWITPEQDPIGQAGATVGALAKQARSEGKALSVAVYGLPGRDCGNHSAGGLEPDDYKTWVAEIGAALDNARDVQKIVVLEPDSLALAPECGNLDERVTQLRGAVAALQSVDTWIYLDGGHSSWLAPERMAQLISAVDVADSVRGFATNVSNFQSLTDEFAYAHAVASHLDGMHAVIDTSRNGTASAGAEWCNPAGQTVGETAGEYGDDVVDTNLWIKPPGESDGPCNGGPAAGKWWPEGAVALTAAAR
ncbi:cellobiohydrolase [Microbacterium oryzae]|uniref:Glucanase n=1 Tax=Microbacterium oryzae TaxID=743009 RepID=A0A6I6DTR6_9MICO|nr:cellobiohydrolase [Microbacterium oryzae]